MRLTKQDFIDRFTPQEFEDLMIAESSSPAVKAWLFRFNNVTPDPDGTSIDTLDPRTIAGVQALEVSGLIAAGRGAEILGTQITSNGFNLGDMIRIKAPFNAAFPDTYSITGLTDSAVQIQDSAEFAFIYVEKV